MAILIKAKMPRSCGDCDLDRWCDLWRVTSLEIRNKDCPIICEVPDGHGRLIDADALEEDAQKRLLICAKYNDQFQKPYEVMRAIALAPTIIPASGKE